MSKPRNVLYVCPNGNRAGAEQVTALLSRYHNRALWNPIIYFFRDGPLVSEMKAMGILCMLRAKQFFSLRLRNPISILMEVKAIATIIRENNISLVHSVMGYGHIFGGLAAWATNTPEVWFQHGPIGKMDRIIGKIPASSVFVNSRFTMNAEKRLAPRSKNIRLVYLGTERCSTAELEIETKKYRALVQKPAEKMIIFGIVARITELKGHLLFIEAAAILFRKKPNDIRACFFIVGDAFLPMDYSYKASVQKKVSDLGMESEVLFLGHQQNPSSAIRACDVIVSASISPEAFGMSLIEAMMLERPVIAPNEGGPAELMTPEQEGLLYEPRSVSGLVGAMEKFLIQPDLCRKMGQNGAKTAQTKFSVTRMLEEVEDEYRKILSPD